MKYMKKRYIVIACEVLFREICLCAAKSRNIIDVSFMKQGYHDIGDKKMQEKLQAEIDRVDVEKYDAILLCYGLCSNGIQDLHAKIPLVIPRAHDCITLLMGSKESYKKYFFGNPGTFFLSSGWLERDEGDVDGGITQLAGLGQDFNYYAEMYDEETAAYLVEMLGDATSNYNKITFIDTGTVINSDDSVAAKEKAQEKNWEYEKITGDTTLILDLLDGEWDEEKYLVVDNGSIVEPSNDDLIIRAKNLTPEE